MTIQSVQTKKLQLLKKKLVLAKALKSLRHLIAMSKEDPKKKSCKLSASELSQLTGDSDGDSSTTMAWWSRTNSHGKSKKNALWPFFQLDIVYFVLFYKNVCYDVLIYLFYPVLFIILKIYNLHGFLYVFFIINYKATTQRIFGFGCIKSRLVSNQTLWQEKRIISW